MGNRRKALQINEKLKLFFVPKLNNFHSKVSGPELLAIAILFKKSLPYAPHFDKIFFISIRVRWCRNASLRLISLLRVITYLCCIALIHQNGKSSYDWERIGTGGWMAIHDFCTNLHTKYGTAIFFL